MIKWMLIWSFYWIAGNDVSDVSAVVVTLSREYEAQYECLNTAGVLQGRVGTVSADCKQKWVTDD